jgi:hypothetical protein
MAHENTNTLDDNIQIGDEAQDFGKKALGAGAVALVAAMAIGGGPFGRSFLSSYLVAFMFILALGLGALWFVDIQHLTNAKWSVVVRRVAEILAANLDVLGILSLLVIVPMAMGKAEFYEWLDPGKVEANHLLKHKAGYLNLQFFLIRCAIYFGFWIILSRYFLKQSVEQDSSGKGEISGTLQKVAAPSMIAFALTLTFCAIDFMMSLDPEFFSTIFGVYYFAGCVSSGYSIIALSLMWLQGKGRLVNSVNREHYHDLGKMMFAFVIFWSYIAFSQFMLIWYGDMPEETHWFKARFAGDWAIISWALLLCHFALPFFGLLSRHVKRNRKTLAFWAFWLLVIEYVDMYWLIMPSMNPETPVGSPVELVVSLLCWVGVIGVYIGTAAMRTKGINLVPTKDPRLADSLAFLNH